jgi:hypothetical protein
MGITFATLVVILIVAGVPYILVVAALAKYVFGFGNGDRSSK